MTALAQRRRRRTLIGAGVATVLLTLAAGLAVVGASTVVNSNEGEEVQGETRPIVLLPNTDNAALAVVDDAGRLTSLIVATLTPDGVGGSIVTVPVNTDASVGLGGTRRPLDADLDLEDPTAFFQAVEGTLAVSLQFGEIVGAERLAELIEPVAVTRPNLPENVVDASGRVVASAGPRVLSSELTVRALSARSEEGPSYAYHENDVEIWSSIASNAPVGDNEPPVDEFERPLPSATLDEVFERLWSGPVQVRDLAIQPGVSAGGVDVVNIDPRDSLLVFAQTSPARVSAPNEGPVFRIEVPFSDAQLAASEDLFATRSELARTLIGELVFLSGNVVSVDTSPGPEAAAVTRIEVSDERFIEGMEQLEPLIFGDIEIVVSTQLIDGVDVVIRVGTGYIEINRVAQGGAGGANGDAIDADANATEADAEADVGDGVAVTGDTVDSDG